MDRYAEAARQEWTEARRKAFWVLLRTSLGSKKAHLIDFSQVSPGLDQGNAVYRGVKTIPLDKIVGSMGRYADFIRTFLPVNEAIGERWQKLAQLRLDPNSRGWPPIDVYQVGEQFFVVDGNHRVSVAHQLKLGLIEARVWELVQPLSGPAPIANIDTFLLESERQDFLHKTHLDRLRPGHTVRLTAPGGYPVLLNQVVAYQQTLSRIDNVEVSFEEAVAAWYDMTYTSTTLLIEQSGVLDSFPDRTAADFFVWVLQYQGRLEAQYGQAEQAGGGSQPSRPNWRLPWRLLRQWLGRSPD